MEPGEGEEEEDEEEEEEGPVQGVGKTLCDARKHSTRAAVTDPNSANVVIIVNPMDFREPGAFPTVTSCIRTAPTRIERAWRVAQGAGARAVDRRGASNRQNVLNRFGPKTLKNN